MLKCCQQNTKNMALRNNKKIKLLLIIIRQLSDYITCGCWLSTCSVLCLTHTAHRRRLTLILINWYWHTHTDTHTHRHKLIETLSNNDKEYVALSKETKGWRRNIHTDGEGGGRLGRRGQEELVFNAIKAYKRCQMILKSDHKCPPYYYTHWINNYWIKFKKNNNK